MARIKNIPVRHSPVMHFRVKVNLWRQRGYGVRGEWEPTTRGRNQRYMGTASRVELAMYLGMSHDLKQTACRLVFRD